MGLSSWSERTFPNRIFFQELCIASIFFDYDDFCINITPHSTFSDFDLQRMSRFVALGQLWLQAIFFQARPHQPLAVGCGIDLRPPPADAKAPVDVPSAADFRLVEYALLQRRIPRWLSLNADISARFFFAFFFFSCSSPFPKKKPG